ncbi:MAG TPA: S-layer homology domain-containing protein, partial [Chloroflexia bacterium]|nr:S-layer homology domain-containing protein [Chloroflexia bacterium]
LTFTQPSCPTSTPTRTATSTPTNTATRTATRTSTATNTPGGPTPTVTNTPVTAPNDVIISEFRLRGPNGANDEFVELYNNTNGHIIVNSVDGSSGWALVASDGATRFVVPNGTLIPARGHFLGVNSVAYSQAGYPAGNGTTTTGDATYNTDIPDNAGIALFRTSNPANFVFANRLDAVGSISEGDPLYKEGDGYRALTPFSIDYSFYRDLRGSNGPKDTNDNAADFLFVDTQGTPAGAGQRLGAPGPENLSSPIYGNLPGGSGPEGSPPVSISLLDPSVPANAAPNFVRDTTSDPDNNSWSGTITVRRKITNNTGVNVTRLRFRITDITTFPEPSAITTTADLRARTSNAVVVSTSGAGNITVQGTTLEEATGDMVGQPHGGAYNSTLSVGSITLATPLPPGQSVNVQFLFGVQQAGCFRLAFDMPGLDYTGTTDSAVCSAAPPTATSTPTSTSTATRTSTATATRTSTATNVPASTNTTIATNTATRTATNVPASTNTATRTATSTAISTATSIATNTPSAPGSSPTSTTQVPPTSTSMPPTATRTATQQAATATATATQAGPVPPTATRTAQPVATATSVPPTCSLQFGDVPAGSAFYSYVRCLTCQTVMGGYPCGGANEPCTDPGATYFRPSALITRGQIAKIVSNAAGFEDTVPTGRQTFEDVAPGSAFWAYIERLTSRGIMSGYNCGGNAEPCGQGDRSYFRPGANATRGQLAKIVANAAGFSDTHSNQMFTDVPASAPFFTWIERLAARGYISGYPCGGPGEPCDAANTPYFRANDNVTRGQASKIVANTFYPNCQMP